jgi:protein tyrosine/serine phosphatase
LLLSLLGVPRATIVADYAVSRRNLRQINERLRSSRTYQQLMAELPEGAYEAEPQTMQGFLGRVDESFGSMSEWASGAGIGSDLVERLRARLLEEA